MFTIIAMSYLTGICYHLIIHGEYGDSAMFLNLGMITAGLFLIPRLFRGEYKVAAFFEFEPHIHRAFITWNITFVCLLAIAYFTKISIVYSRGWMLLFYISAFPPLILLRYIFVHTTASLNSAGLVFARRVFLIGSGQQIDDFIGRYQPWSLGINVVGCRFLTPLPRDASNRQRQETVERDLLEAANCVRDLEPDSIFLVFPWSATELINRCADRFMS
jgi:hypothetical protein